MFSIVDVFTKMKPTPGTPSKHLLDDAATESNLISLQLRERAPNALIASMNKDFFFIATKFAISFIGFRMPEVVSQYTTSTCVKSLFSSIIFSILFKS